MPTRQNRRETTSRTTARATAPGSANPDRRLVRPSAGTVMANATGTTKVSAARSHGGWMYAHVVVWPSRPAIPAKLFTGAWRRGSAMGGDSSSGLAGEVL